MQRLYKRPSESATSRHLKLPIPMLYHSARTSDQTELKSASTHERIAFCAEDHFTRIPAQSSNLTAPRLGMRSIQIRRCQEGNV